MIANKGLICTEGTIFEFSLLDNHSFECVHCNKQKAVYACQICLKLGINPVRFCSDECFVSNWTQHKQIHSSISARARKLADDHIDTTKRIIAKEGALFRNDKEIQTLQRQETKLSTEIELYRLRIQVYELQCKLSKAEEDAEEKLRELQQRSAASNAAEEDAIPLQGIVVTYDELFQKQKEFQEQLSAKEEELVQLEAASQRAIQKATLEKEIAVDKAENQAEVVREMDILLMHLQNAGLPAPASGGVGTGGQRLQALEQELREVLASIEQETQQLPLETAEYERRIAALEARLVEDDHERRHLRNTISELRGNVRVFARVRPFHVNDGIDINAPPEATVGPRNDGVSMVITKPGDKPEETRFQFDKNFGPASSQEEVFKEVSEFVQSALDGYNVCLFSYGQTGSGKTYSMQGIGNGVMRGIIPRAMEQVGQYKAQLEAKGWEYHMDVSFVEIYNETVRDLLRDSQVDDVKHEIKRDADGITYISDITLLALDPNKSEEIEEVMELASRYRAVGATNMNEQSSRSHSVFTLYLKATQREQQVELNGTLSLVDLAGSERLDRSGATGERAKEAVSINKSLSALADVFSAIGHKQAFVPFRNSKLTYLLQPCLSGDGKTLMMVNVSPTAESYFESLSAMKFAAMVNKCELGKPKRQIKEQSSSEDSKKKKDEGSPKQQSSRSSPNRKL